jgi:hypothetical protein
MVPSLFHPAGSLASVWSPIVAAAPHHFKGGVGRGDQNIKLQTELTFQLTCICSTHRSVSPDMLFLGLFIVSNQKNLFGNHDWYLKGIGTSDRDLGSEDYAFVKWTVCTVPEYA